MPTQSEIQELMDLCTWEWTSINGVNGYKVSGNGNSIFLPATYRKECGVTYDYLKGYGYYWTSSVSSRYSRYQIYFSVNTYYVSSGTSASSAYGYPIRPVLP
jgi:hypothetical protein